MKNGDPRPQVLIVSDSAGDTAEQVTRAAASQFDVKQIRIERINYIKDRKGINKAIEVARSSQSIIVFTLVVPELRAYLLENARHFGIHAVDIMGPMLDGLQLLFREPPRLTPGMIHPLDEDYFRKVDAIEFAVNNDDGKDVYGFSEADLILVGISRTSKTPLSMYLAYRGVKVANVPLVPEVTPPEELFTQYASKCVGLTIQPSKLNEIRTERLKALGLRSEANYAKMDRIIEEINYAFSIMERLKCPVLDVSYKAVEETANLILKSLKKKEGM